MTQSNWTDHRTRQLLDGVRLMHLSDTPLWVAQEAWIGQPVLDRRGQRLGSVSDLLVEVRSLDEACGMSEVEWGVRAAYAEVACRASRWPFARRRTVCVPIAGLREVSGGLQSDEDAFDLRLMLFGTSRLPAPAAWAL